MVLSLSLPKPFNLDTTVRSHGWFQVRPFRYDFEGRELTRIMPIPGVGPRPVSVRQKGGRLQIDAPSGLGRPAQKWVKDRWRHMLCLDWDLSGFYRLCRTSPRLKRVIKAGGGRLLRCGDPWEESVKGICGTNVTWKQAVQMINRLGVLGKKAPGGEPAWPAPRDVLHAGESWLREEVRLGYRAPYVMDLARGFSEGAFAVPEPDQGTAKEAFKAYKALPGIGPATAHYLMILNGHFATMSVDSAVHAFVRNHYSDGKTLTEKEVRDLFAPYGEWVGLAYWWEYMVHSGWLAKAR